eukprot:Gb_00836 [translate_table: standard]
MPGMTISPSPSIEKGRVESAVGKSSLIGASKDLATLTITGVKKTQKISYTKSPARRMAPVLKDPRDNISIPCIQKANPKMLFANQCFFNAYHVQKNVPGMAATTCDLVNSTSTDLKYGRCQFIGDSFQLFGRNRSTAGNNVADNAIIPRTKK